jgi:hypothetical protein
MGDGFIKGRCDQDCALAATKDFTNTPVSTLADFRKEIDALPQGGWIFRGTSNSEYRLHSSLDRALEGAAWDDERPRRGRHLEHALFRQFVREAHLRIEHAPAEDDVLEWLAVMRHYDVPTRILDWSYSPWIALFFAAAGATTGTAAVWALDTERLDAAANALARAAGNLDRAVDAWRADLHCRKPETFYGLYNPATPVRFVLKQNCWRSNPRLNVQQGVFLCPGDVEACFQRNLAAVLRSMEDDPKKARGLPLRRLEFPASEAASMMIDLYRYGISHASLYPDLEGFSKMLKRLPKMPMLQARDLDMPGIGSPTDPTRRGPARGSNEQ